jgi:hypothetical protein
VYDNALAMVQDLRNFEVSVHICQVIHPFDNYVIWPGSLALMNCEPITLRNLLMHESEVPRPKSIYDVIIERVYCTCFDQTAGSDGSTHRT